MDRRAVVLLSMLAVAGCSDDPAPPTNPAPPDGLRIDFEPVPYETGLSYISDMAFAPGSSEAIVIDLYGGFELIDVGAERAEVLLGGLLGDVYVEYDAGLLAVAIDPDFANNNYFYMAQNLTRSLITLRRFTLDRGDAAATVASAVTIVDIDAMGSPRWHNISSMGFDEQGIMWALVGGQGRRQPRG